MKNRTVLLPGQCPGVVTISVKLEWGFLEVLSSLLFEKGLPHGFV